ncbi:MAG TPA: DUF309 domain-containing protein [Planctomycetes bacterium]|nr:DUF309 domain-containing protein [Planctomycetota bacterium]
MRYCPGRPLPPYRFLPGRDPHPTRDPAGHSYGRGETAASYVKAEDWDSNEDYLFGVDLYNEGFLWEAHEAWEGIWMAARGDELQATFLQGLIQCAAACLKIRMEQPRGLERLGNLGAEKLERVAEEASERFMGLAAGPFAEAFRAFLASCPDDIEVRPRIELEG